MKAVVIGATGRVGQEVVKDLAEKGHAVVAAARTAMAQSWPEGVEARDLDLHGSVLEIAAVISDCDGIIFTAGSRGKDLLQTDAFGAVKVMKAAQAAGIRRFVMLSSFMALRPAVWEQVESLKGIMNYNIAKFFADEWLTRSEDLDWTILQPGNLMEEPGTGKIEVDPEEGGSNPIPDVAETLAIALDMPNTVGRVIMMRSGDVPIADALASV